MTHTIGRAVFTLAFVSAALASPAAWADAAATPAGAPASATAATPPAATPAAASGETAAADKPSPNTIYAEGLGAAIAYSINYERRVIDDLGVRAGFSYLSFSASAGTASSSASLMSFPITASYLGVRGRKSGLEVGGGVNLMYASGAGSSLGRESSSSGLGALPLAMIGYRLHPVDGAGFNFRVGLMAFAGSGVGFSAKAGEFGFLPWGYISFGASF